MSEVISSYIGVLLAELCGDRAIYALAALAVEVPIVSLFAVATAGFSAKMLVATILGANLARVRPPLLHLVSAGGFIFAALAVARPIFASRGARTEEAQDRRTSLGAFLTAIAIEWADPGQIAAASLAAQSHSWFLVWLGASAAMATKAAIGITLGVTVRRWLPLRPVRILAIAGCMSMALLSLLLR